MAQAAAFLCHEMRTPLASLRGYMEMMQEGMMGPLTPEQEKGLAVSLRSIDRIELLIDAFMESTHGMVHKVTLHPELFCLDALITECMETVSPDAKAREIRMEFDHGPGQIFIHADRLRISQALLNLFTNALKFNIRRGRVNICLTREAEVAIIRVDDNGLGIPRKEQEKIFDRYYRVGMHSTRESSGSGIGLTLAREIISLHGGTIRVESLPARGSSFRITLPLNRVGDSTSFYFSFSVP